jgi:hypothetical protein
LASKKQSAASDVAQQRRDVKAAFNAGAFIVKGDKHNFREKTEVVRYQLTACHAAHIATKNPRTTTRYAALFEESLQEEKKAADFPELCKGNVLCAEPKSTSTWANLVKKTPDAEVAGAACPVAARLNCEALLNKPAPSGKYSWADEEDIGGALSWDPNDDSAW